jgi:CBS domain containing-hemolysin-like protein
MNEWFLILITIILSSFFSGSEIAYVTANRLKLELKVRQNGSGASFVNYFIKNPEAFLSTTLIGNNIVNVLYATFMTLFLTGPISSLYEAWVGVVPTDLTLLIIQTIVASVIILLFGEILPKILFRVHADTIFSYLAPPLRFVGIVLKPLVWAADSISRSIVRLFKIETTNVEQLFRRQDIELLLHEMSEDGGHSDIDREETEILTNVLKLSGMRVKESMITRTEIQAVEINSSVPDVLKLFVTSGFSKLPVYDESIDNIIGMVYAYDLFNRPQTLLEIIRPIKLVPSSRKSKDLLAEFRRSNNSMAVVIDEYGGTAGLITIEDLLEEVVGDIQDEYDTDDVIIKKVSDTTWIIGGMAYLEDVDEKFPELMIPRHSDDYETLTGHITFNLGRIPRVNEEILIDSFKFIITKATPTRIETVKVVKMDGN